MLKAVSFRAARDQLEIVSAIFSNNNQIIEAYTQIVRHTLGAPRFQHAASVSACFKSRLFHPWSSCIFMKCFSDFGISSRREDEQGLELPVSGLDDSLNTYLRCAFPQDSILRPFMVSRSF
jgi:hypothetical protein